jgi:hypothetical protein
MYDEPSQLVPTLMDALAEVPAALSPAELNLLSWDGACERLLDAALTSPRESAPPRSAAGADLAFAVTHFLNTPPFDDYFRQNSGATPLYDSWPTRLAALLRAEQEARTEKAKELAEKARERLLEPLNLKR